MRRMIWAATVCVMLGGVSAAMACENHRQQEPYPRSLEPDYTPDQTVDIYASTTQTPGGYKLAGVGVGGAMIGLGALLARRRA